MIRDFAWTSKSRRASSAAAAALPVLAVFFALGPSAWAGRFHVYACRTPAGEEAPVDGWGGSSSGAKSYALNTCAQPGGALVAALGLAPRTAETDKATWAFGAPSAETLVGATLWRAGDAAGGAEASAGFEFWFAGPENVISVPADNFGQCAGGSLCPVGAGVIGQPFAPANRLSVPSQNVGGRLFMNASCVGTSGYPCPEGKGDPNGYAAAVYLYAADLILEQAATPTAGNVGGEVASAGTLTGRSDLTFDAADPGAGVYEAVFSVDGQTVQRTVLDENGGRCRNVGQTTDGTLAFLYLHPCAGSVGADVAFDSTAVPNGVHHLLVTVVDAAGNAAPVLDRTVTIDNPPPPGPPNGTNASTKATLTARWQGHRGSTLTTGYGRAGRIVGRLTAPGGAAIAGALVEVQALTATTGRVRATVSARTGRDGGFAVRLPRRLCSGDVQVSYRARIGDSAPAALRTLQLRVRAGIALTIAPRTASAGSSIFFSGRLRGGPIPAEGKQLVLEARSPGGAWIEFKVVRTDSHGRYRASYRFRFPGPALYEFRAVSEPESDYPYAAGSSRALLVRER
jgi:hypothetical protein